MIAIVVLTYNRLHLLRQCVENVLARTSAQTTEIVIWDNGSADATPDYLRSLEDPRIRVVLHPENLGQNAYAQAFAMPRLSGQVVVLGQAHRRGRAPQQVGLRQRKLAVRRRANRQTYRAGHRRQRPRRGS